MSFESFDAYDEVTAAYTPLQHRASQLGNQLVLEGHASIDELDRLLGWATHPDCSTEECQQIVDLFQQRLDAAQSVR